VPQGLATFTPRPHILHVFLNGAFADANAEFQQLAANPFRTPEHVAFGHRPDEHDNFPRQSPRLTTRSGLSSPDDLQEIPMPAQQRFRFNDVQSVPPSVAQAGQDEQKQAVIRVAPRSPDAAT